MTSSDTTPRIYIVGASLSGLTLVLSLLNQSDDGDSPLPYRITLYEARSPAHIATVNRSITLPPNALRILDRLDGKGGLLKRLREKGFGYERVRVIGLDGEEKGPGMLVGGKPFEY